jgi:cyclophilin family peptidyl-prolyl cis-trans isomerase
LHYNTEGVVGMASAGANTEATQWFVTHSPTFHLDQNYTIFAEVVEGMAVVQGIQVGDSIQSVNIE